MQPNQKLADALIEILKGDVMVSHQAVAKLRRKFEAAIDEHLKPAAQAPALAQSLAETAKALEGDRLYTTHDIGRLFQVDASTVSKWIDGKKLVAFRTPGGHRRVRAQDLRAFAVEHGMPITGELAA